METETDEPGGEPKPQSHTEREAEERRVRELTEICDRVLAAVLRSDKQELATLAPEVASKPIEYFEDLVRKAAAVALPNQNRRDPIPPLVRSALDAGRPLRLAREQAAGDQITESQLTDSNHISQPPDGHRRLGTIKSKRPAMNRVATPSQQAVPIS